MSRKRKDPPVPEEAGLERLVVRIPVGLSERLRNAVHALQGPPHLLRLNRAVTEALSGYVAGLEREHARGRPFPQRAAPLTGGGRV